MSATPLKRVLATPSVWIQAAKQAATKTFPQLKGNGGHPTFDVAVVGAGIFGINCALKLHRAGKKVVVLEGRRVGMGTTGTSTCKFTSQQNVIYSKLAKMHGHEIAKKYGTMQESAIREVFDIVNTYKLDCDMSSRSHTTWTSQESQVSTIKQEYEEAVKCGLPAELITDPSQVELPASVGMKAAVRFTGQLQLNAYAYCVELAKVLDGMGVPIYEESRVTEVSSETPHRVSTEQGYALADHVILATHMPIMDRSCHFAFLPPSRSFCIAVKLKSSEEKTQLYEPKPSRDSVHDMYISVDQPMRSLRPGTSQSDDILVVAGESIEVGKLNKSPSEEHYENLEKWAREHFKVESIIARWSAMDYISSDLLPYIGYLYRGTETIYTSTGQSKWGLLNGVAGANIITDLIMKKQNPYASMVDARRWDLLKQAAGLLTENIQTTKHFIGDKLSALVAPDIKTLRSGEGGIVKKDGQTIGAYLDQNGTYHVVKPICTHLGCHLMFNQGDGVWDCPCHGSQFSVDGEVLHGPACKDLLKPELTW